MLNFLFTPSFEKFEDFVNPEKIYFYFNKKKKLSDLINLLNQVIDKNLDSITKATADNNIAHLLCQFEHFDNVPQTSPDTELKIFLPMSKPHDYNWILTIQEYRFQLLYCLINRGLNLNVRDDKGNTALFYLVNKIEKSFPEKETILLLVKHMDREFSDKFNKINDTIFHMLASSKCFSHDLVEELLELGFTFKMNSGRILPSYVASMERNFKFEDHLLCLKEANVNVTLDNWIYALHLLYLYDYGNISLLKIAICFKNIGAEYTYQKKTVIENISKLNLDDISILWLEYHLQLSNKKIKFIIHDELQSFTSRVNGAKLMEQYRNLNNYYSCKNISYIEVESKLIICDHKLFSQSALAGLKLFIEECVKIYIDSNNENALKIAKCIVDEIGLFQPQLILCFAHHVQSFDASLAHSILYKILPHHKKEYYEACLMQAEILIIHDCKVGTLSFENKELLTAEQRYRHVFNLLGEIISDKNLPKSSMIFEQAERLRHKIINIFSNNQLGKVNFMNLEVTSDNVFTLAYELNKQKHNSRAESNQVSQRPKRYSL